MHCRDGVHEQFGSRGEVRTEDDGYENMARINCGTGSVHEDQEAVADRRGLVGTKDTGDF